MKTLRIFISSPGDVEEERQRARQVVDSLKRRYAGVFTLKPLLWEELALQSDAPFQEGIDRVLSAAEGIDVAVFILWSRMGELQDGGPYRSGTEREFALMRAAREQSGGERPALLVYTREDDASFAERLRGRPTEQQRELVEQKATVERFIQETFQDGGTGRNLRAYHRFDRPQTFSQRLRAHLVDYLDELSSGGVAEVVWDVEVQGAPFMGLEAFGESQAVVFCGRENEVLEARRALAGHARQGCAFLLITGASGSGKSSLARAGLLPTVAEHELDETVAEWRTLVAPPSELGADPVAGLLERLVAPELLPGLRVEGMDSGDLADSFRAEPESTVRLVLRPAVASAAKERGGGIRVLLLLDQLEEVFALGAEARASLLGMVEALARSGVVWVSATVRSDFLGEVHAEETLARLLEGRPVHTVPAPGPDALRRMIEEPARLAGLTFEEREGGRLSDRILSDAAEHADLLPLLEFVLLRLYEKRSEEGLLGWAAYEEVGGVEGALRQKAEEIYGGLRNDPEAQAALPAVLKKLVTVGEAAGDGAERLLRQRAGLVGFPVGGAARRLVDALVAGRLLTAESGDAWGTVTVAHEALLRVWPRAAAWAEGNRELLRVRARVSARMGEEGTAGIAEGDPLLETAKVHLSADPEAFTDEQHRFIEGSVRAAEAHRKRRERLRGLVVAGMGALTTLALIGAGVAFAKQREAEVARSKASLSEKSAVRARDGAERLLDNMLFDLRKTLVSIGRTDVMASLAKSAKSYYADLDESQRNPESERRLNISTLIEGDALYASGRTAEARPLFEEVFRQFEDQARLHGGDAASSDLALAHNRLGDLFYHTTELERCQYHYEAAVGIREKLLAKAPQDPLLKQRAAAALARLGHVLNARRKAREAIPHLLRAVELADSAQARAMTEGGTAGSSFSLDEEEFWADPSMPSYRLGSSYESVGMPEEAMEMHVKALAIREELLREDPTSALRRREVAWSLLHVSRFLGRRGDRAGELDYQQRARSLFEGLCNLDPTNLVWQKDLAWCLRHQANEAWLRDQKDEALLLARRAVDIWRQASSQDIGNMLLLRDYRSMLMEYLSYLRQSERVEEGMALIDSLVEEASGGKGPTAETAQHSEVRWLTWLSVDALKNHQVDEGLSIWQRCLPMWKDLIPPENVATDAGWIESHLYEIKQQLRAVGLFEEAFDANKLRLDLLKSVVSDTQVAGMTTVDWTGLEPNLLADQASLMASLNDFPEAVKWQKLAVQSRMRLIGVGEVDFTRVTDAAKAWSELRAYQGKVNDRKGALHSGREAVALLEGVDPPNRTESWLQRASSARRGIITDYKESGDVEGALVEARAWLGASQKAKESEPESRWMSWQLTEARLHCGLLLLEKKDEAGATPESLAGLAEAVRLAEAESGHQQISYLANGVVGSFCTLLNGRNSPLATAAFDAVIHLRERQEALGHPESDPEKSAAKAHAALGVHLWSLGREAEARAEFAAAVAMAEASRRQDVIHRTNHAIRGHFSGKGKFDEAEPYARRAFEAAKAGDLGWRPIEAASALVSSVLNRSGKFEEAEGVGLEAWEFASKHDFSGEPAQLRGGLARNLAETYRLWFNREPDAAKQSEHSTWLARSLDLLPLDASLNPSEIPNAVSVRFLAAPHWIEAGDLNRYRDERRQILLLAAGTTSVSVAKEVSRFAILLPTDPSETEQVARLSAIGYADISPDQASFSVLVHAITLLRMGRAGDALEAVDRVKAPWYRDARAPARSIRAIILNSLGRRNEAEEELSLLESDKEILNFLANPVDVWASVGRVLLAQAREAVPKREENGN